MPSKTLLQKEIPIKDNERYMSFEDSLAIARQRTGLEPIFGTTYWSDAHRNEVKYRKTRRLRH